MLSASFDVWAGTFCVSATNGHRITNASHGIDHGNCERPLTPTTTPSQETAANSGGAPASSLRACVNADLQLALGPVVSAMTGEHAVIYSLTNRASTQCSLSGFPRVTFQDRAGNALPFRYSHAGSTYVPKLTPSPVKLRPSDAAFFIAAQYRCDLGVVMTAATISVRLPSNRTSAPVRPALIASHQGGQQLAYCKGGTADPGNVMAVSPFSANVATLLAEKSFG